MAVLVVLLIVLGAVVLVGLSGLYSIPPDAVGVVVKRFGRRRPDDDPRVRLFGARAREARPLRPNTLHWRLRFLYKVERIPMTRVPFGTIGVVVARAGAVSRIGQSLARYVDCDRFTDGVRFLRNGGERGRQQEV